MFDAALQFCDEQAVTAAAKSTNSIPTKATERRLGSGRQLGVAIIVKETMDDTGDNSTLQVDLESSPDTPASPLTNPVVRQTLITFAALTAAGTKRWIALRPDILTQRAIQLSFTPGGGDLSAGKFSAWLCEQPDETWVAYPDATEIT